MYLVYCANGNTQLTDIALSAGFERLFTGKQSGSA
jgi:hypothetical protein